ncbi:MAG: PEP-CTERM sorting domain-containing protein [Chthonomonas sp.]|nr:PEP-CTERM sorting domain-containing protein [Chthonomonas sp.]
MKKLLLLSALAVGPAASFGHFETEANDTWLTPNNISMAIGDVVQGTTSGTSLTVPGLGSADHFKLNFGAQAMGVYRNRMALDLAGFTGSLVGRTTTSATSSTSIQSMFSLAGGIQRMNQWYSFGAAHSVDYKVTGVSSTSTLTYTATHSQSAVSVTGLGTVSAGVHVIDTFEPSMDTEIYLLDMNGNTLEWNDETTDAATDSAISYNFVAGQSYYIAVGRYNTAANVGASDVGVVEAGEWLTASYFANGNMLATSSNTAGTYALRLDGANVANGAYVAGTEAYDIHFYGVRAVPEPGSMAALGLGLAALARRRRNKK